MDHQFDLETYRSASYDGLSSVLRDGRSHSSCRLEFGEVRLSRNQQHDLEAAKKCKNVVCDTWQLGLVEKKKECLIVSGVKLLLCWLDLSRTCC